MNGYSYSPWVRYQKEIRETVVIAIVLVFFFLYLVIPPLHGLIDALVTPAVSGITLLYGRASTAVYRSTGLDFGFVTVPPDPDFLYSVRLATYVNERRAAPLLDLAVDSRLPTDKRERALRAVLKFENTSEWVQPFLNELAKGGLLYEGTEPIKETPLVDELIQRIRSEGGVRQTLVRAYAEVAFSFMLQHPNEIIRSHALRWLSDVLAEDAIFLIIPRLDKETDAGVQRHVEEALYNVRAVSDPKEAIELLMPYYRSPPWPAVRRPIGAILARLGDPGAHEYVAHELQSEEITSSERAFLRLALAGTRLPRTLTVDEPTRLARNARQKEREQQYYAAMAKRERMRRTEIMKRQLLAMRTRETAAATKEPPVEQVAQAPERTPEPVAPPVKQPPVETQAPPEQPAAPEETPAPVEAPPPAQPPAVRKPPKSFPVKGYEQPEAPAEKPAAETKPPQQMAYVPEDTLPPPIEQVPRKPKSVMNYVDMIFEVKDQDVPLYANPGADGANGVVLPVGSKGKATFEVQVGEEKWYEVKTKRGNGWANGALLSMYSLSPTGEVPATATKPAGETVPESLNARERTESTYFEASDDHVTMYDKPGKRGKKLGELVEGTPYLAIKSEKADNERWFQLKIRSDLNAWVNGVYIKLADVVQPAQMQVPTSSLSLRGQKSAFTAEWVVATVKGVGVYSRPSIAGNMVRQINPGDIYKVLETNSGGGNEWYKISLAGKKEGWVQSMDVSLTKPTSK